MPFVFKKWPSDTSVKVTAANGEMAKFVYVRQPAAGDRTEFRWSLIEHSTPVDHAQKIPKSNDDVDG